MFTKKLQAFVRRCARRFVESAPLKRFSPNTLTVMGLVITGIAAVCIALGQLVVGGIVLLGAGAFDVLDGAVARATGKVYPYGAFLDSTTDRYAEGFTYMALLAYFLGHGHSTVEPLLVGAALAGSFLVSYVRARAQSLGFTCDGGILARPERIVITAIGLIISVTLVPALWILAILTNVTALQRVWFVWRQSSSSPTRS